MTFNTRGSIRLLGSSKAGLALVQGIGKKLERHLGADSLEFVLNSSN